MSNIVEVRKGHEFDSIALRSYLIQNVAEFKDTICPRTNLEVKQFNHGQSNPTYLVSQGQLKFVLRKKPPGKLLRGAHAIDREFKI